MVCRYCGLETGTGVGHRSQTECIQALTIEINRAKELMSRARVAGQPAEQPKERSDVPEEEHLELT